MIPTIPPITTLSPSALYQLRMVVVSLCRKALATRKGVQEYERPSEPDEGY